MFDQFLKTPAEIHVRKGDHQGQEKYINQEKAALEEEYIGQFVIDMLAEVLKDAKTNKGSLTFSTIFLSYF